MKTILKESGLTWEMIDGVVGADLEESYLQDRFEHYAEMKLSRGKYGCLLSHALC